jgi:hypothetical protein
MCNDDMIRTKADLLNYLTKMITEYHPKCNDSIRRNHHMLNRKKFAASVPDTDIEDILTDFVNYVGSNQGLDWGLYVRYLDLDHGKDDNV